MNYEICFCRYIESFIALTNFSMHILEDKVHETGLLVFELLVGDYHYNII